MLSIVASIFICYVMIIVRKICSLISDARKYVFLFKSYLHRKYKLLKLRTIKGRRFLYQNRTLRIHERNYQKKNTRVSAWEL